jgi:hypothetical protein
MRVPGIKFPQKTLTLRGAFSILTAIHKGGGFSYLRYPQSQLELTTGRSDALVEVEFATLGCWTLRNRKVGFKN